MSSQLVISFLFIRIIEWTEQINHTQVIIAGQKKELERLKNSLQIVEKGNNVVELENKVKAVAIEIEQLNHRRRGFENTSEIQ